MGRDLVVDCKEIDFDWRASRVPAAAVIPAPIVSMVNAAVKKSVVLIVAVCVVIPLFIGGKGCMASVAQRMRGVG